MQRALLSVSDKTGVVDLARGLAAHDCELVSTGGTARELAAAGLPVTSVSDLTGFPEMMGGRVKTLHPKIHGAILGRRDESDDRAAMARHGIQPIDIVVVNLYPFARAAADPTTPFDALVEEIDIGGPSLVRAAAKNFRDVLIVIDPADYSRLLAALDETPTLQFRFELMRKAIAHTAAYDAAITATLAAIALEGDHFERTAQRSVLPVRFDLPLEKIRDLRYGENPHQKAAWYRPSGSPSIPPGGFGSSSGPGEPTILQGKQLSYTNILDLESAARVVIEFDDPAAAVVKHTNPCGVATGINAAAAFVGARDADRLAAYGGIAGLNRPIDFAAAEAIVSTFIEGVIAPSVEADARAVLARKANMRVVTADVTGGLELRSALGGVLVQERDRVVEAERVWTLAAAAAGVRVVTKRQPTPAEWEALRFAWRVCAHVKSNTVVFTDAQHTLAIGAGQMSRVDAVNVAVMKAAAAKVALAGSAAASDAFFPFRDGLDAVARAGATSVVQPGGSLRDPEVIAAADEHGLTMVFTGRRHFKH
jgi:phosphoribosylaminoimidazolecarboxamide formyltransferase/IMP cyclohydrolase